MANHLTGPHLNKEIDRGGQSREWYSLQPRDNDPEYSTYYNDFLAEQDYAAADWVVTEVGAATQALAADEDGGALLVTNAAADDDSSSQQGTQENWRLSSGKPCWFEARVKISDADQCDMYMGLAIRDTTPLDASDRVGLRISDGDASIFAESTKNSTDTSTDSGKDAEDDTYLKLGFYWDGVNRVRYYVNSVRVAEHTADIPDDENLTITWHLQNGEAVAKNMTIDYIKMCQKR